MPYEIGYDYGMVGYDPNGYDLAGLDFIGEDELDALLAGESWGTVGAGLVPMRRGAPPARRAPMGMNPGAMRAMQMAIAQRRAQQGALVRESPPTKSREYVLGIDSVVTIAAGATAVITNRPQCLYRPERFVISAAVASLFAINDIRVGKNSQFAAAGAVPGDMFGPGAFGVRLKCDTAQISNDVTCNVTNISGGAARFLAGVVGEAVE